MIAVRCTSVNALGVTIKPSFAERAKPVIARSISVVSWTPSGRSSTPNVGATNWIAPNWPAPAAISGSRMTPTRVTRGAICLSSSSHFPLMPYSAAVKPVALVPGRAKLSTNPPPKDADWLSKRNIEQLRSYRQFLAKDTKFMLISRHMPSEDDQRELLKFESAHVRNEILRFRDIHASLDGGQCYRMLEDYFRDIGVMAYSSDVDVKALKYLTSQMLGFESGFGKVGAAAIASIPETLDKMFGIVAEYRLEGDGVPLPLCPHLDMSDRYSALGRHKPSNDTHKKLYPVMTAKHFKGWVGVIVSG
jgi:hypothetical protein